MCDFCLFLFLLHIYVFVGSNQLHLYWSHRSACLPESGVKWTCTKRLKLQNKVNICIALIGERRRIQSWPRLSHLITYSRTPTGPLFISTYWYNCCYCVQCGFLTLLSQPLLRLSQSGTFRQTVDSMYFLSLGVEASILHGYFSPLFCKKKVCSFQFVMFEPSFIKWNFPKVSNNIFYSLILSVYCHSDSPIQCKQSPNPISQ